MAQKARWVKVEDSKVRHVWECVCGNRVRVDPTFYAESGTPFCTGQGPECEGTDMVYVKTEILVG